MYFETETLWPILSEFVGNFSTFWHFFIVCTILFNKSRKEYPLFGVNRVKLLSDFTAIKCHSKYVKRCLENRFPGIEETLYIIVKLLVSSFYSKLKTITFIFVTEKINRFSRKAFRIILKLMLSDTLNVRLIRDAYIHDSQTIWYARLNGMGFLLFRNEKYVFASIIVLLKRNVIFIQTDPVWIIKRLYKTSKVE